MNKYEDATLTNSINGNHFIQYTKDDEEVNDRMKRPVYLGNLIYAYAREYMYDTCIHKYESIAYQDTDSAFIAYNDYLKFIYELPHLQLHKDVKNTLSTEDYEKFLQYYPNIINRIDKEFGDFEVEAIVNDGYYL